jgi:p-aminobenzoyl-glutamate transporter AbgT
VGDAPEHVNLGTISLMLGFITITGIVGMLIVAMMLPYAVVVSVAWIVLFIAWELLGIPFGPV